MKSVIETKVISQTTQLNLKLEFPSSWSKCLVWSEDKTTRTMTSILW